LRLDSVIDFPLVSVSVKSGAGAPATGAGAGVPGVPAGTTDDGHQRDSPPNSAMPAARPTNSPMPRTMIGARLDLGEVGFKNCPSATGDHGPAAQVSNIGRH